MPLLQASCGPVAHPQGHRAKSAVAVQCQSTSQQIAFEKRNSKRTSSLPRMTAGGIFRKQNRMTEIETQLGNLQEASVLRGPAGGGGGGT